MSHLHNFKVQPRTTAGAWQRNAVPRSTGLGAIFRVQRLRGEASLFCEAAALAEIDPTPFAEWISGAVRSGAEFLPLEEVHRRLSLRSPGKIFALTFDGATRGVFEHAYPVLKSLSVPFTIFASPAMHDNREAPWWIALEALIARCERMSLSLRGQVFRVTCRSSEEKSESLDNLVSVLMGFPEHTVRRAVSALCEAEGIDLHELASEYLMPLEDIRALAADPLASFGLLAPDCHAAGGAAYDLIRDTITSAKTRLVEITGYELRHLGFSAGWHGFIEPHHLDIAAKAGFTTACLPGGGVLLYEEPGQFLSLPRVLISNHPDVMHEVNAICGVTLMHFASERRAISAA